MKYIKVMMGLNAEQRMRAQPFKLVQREDGDDQDDDEYGDAQDAIDADNDVVEITRFGDIEVEAKVGDPCPHASSGLQASRGPSRIGLICARSWRARPDSTSGSADWRRWRPAGKIPRSAGVPICPVSIAAGRGMQQASVDSKSSTRASGRA